MGPMWACFRVWYPTGFVFFIISWLPWESKFLALSAHPYPLPEEDSRVPNKVIMLHVGDRAPYSGQKPPGHESPTKQPTMLIHVTPMKIIMISMMMMTMTMMMAAIIESEPFKISPALIAKTLSEIAIILDSNIYIFYLCYKIQCQYFDDRTIIVVKMSIPIMMLII